MRTRVIQDGPAPSRGAPSQAPVRRRSVVARHPMVTFFVLSYAIAWGWLPFGSFGAFAPLVAAVVVIALSEGRPGFRRWGARMVPWRVGGRWYAAAVALPVGTLVLAGSLNRMMGAPAPDLAQFTPWYTVLLLFAVNVVNPLGGPMGEEPGWRGFAQPGLQRTRSPLAATSIMAVLVAGWHLPLLMPQYGLRPVELLSTVAVTFWYAWLFNSSGGSIVPALVAHAVDASLETSTLWIGSDSTRLITSWAFVASTLAVVLVVADWRSWTRRDPHLFDLDPSHTAIRAGRQPLSTLEES